ncbi:hypothetical protein T03_15381 [Trichinella britovi]|uniref:Uncharacterized protein n=1 Tax=Trichinella britovi TaxID=45882 RepID=A0A0V1CJY2_TRIBR|nr:hypothetical protein T03_15381 [Trichinella britovi]
MPLRMSPSMLCVAKTMIIRTAGAPQAVNRIAGTLTNDINHKRCYFVTALLLQRQLPLVMLPSYSTIPGRHILVGHLATGDALFRNEADNVDNGNYKIASRQADDRPFRIAESTHVDQKRQHSEKGTGSTHHRPNANPYAYNFQLLFRKEHMLAG